MKKILIILLSCTSCFAYRLQVRNMADESFQLQVTSTGGAVTAPARAMGNLDFGIDVQVLSGPSNGISGRYVGTGEPNLRVFIQDGLPVITIDATTDNPTQNMTYSDSDKSKAAQVVQQSQNSKTQSTTPTIQPAVVVQSAQPQPTQSTQQPTTPASQSSEPNQPATTTASTSQPASQPSSQQGQPSGKEHEGKHDEKKDDKKDHPKQSDAQQPQNQQQQTQSQSSTPANSSSSSSGN